MSHPIESIRNLALLGHTGAGKTQLAEALLHAAGAISQTGEAGRGNTVGDSDPLERERGHTLGATLLGFDHDDCRIHLFDTPGLQDFRGPALSAMAAIETAIIVVSAAAGLEPGAIRLMDRARSRGLCRMLVVNRIDAGDADIAMLLEQIRERFGSECLPLNLPADSGQRVVDCFFNTDGDSDLGPVRVAHQRIIDQVVEIDDSLMEHYLEDGEAGLGRKELHDAFEQCLREGHLVPVCFTSARSGAGVRELLEVIVRLLPNPAEGNPPPFQVDAPEGRREARALPDPEAHVIAHVLRVSNDPFVGKQALLRVYQGTLRRDLTVYVGEGRKAIRIAHLHQPGLRDSTEVDAVGPGGFCLLSRIDELHYDAVVHDSHDEDHWHLRPLDLPQPMFGLALNPSRHGQEQKLNQGLHRLAEEDPCLHVEHHAELNETVLRGLGELHLRTALQRLSQRYGVEVEARTPRVAYRETIAASAEGHYRHKKQTGGAGQFGEVHLRVAPLPRGSGYRFVDAVVGGAIPHNLIPAVDKGVQQALKAGVVAGFPVQDIEVTVFDGKHHPVDSKEIAFVIAGRRALQAAVKAAKPTVLEPLVRMDLQVPEEQIGDVSGRLAGHRGRILGSDAAAPGEARLLALMPLAEIDAFATELRALTAGRGRFQIEPEAYEAVPPSIQQALCAAWQPRHEED